VLLQYRDSLVQEAFVSLALLLLLLLLLLSNVLSAHCTVMRHVMLNSVYKRMCQEHQEKTQTKSTAESRCGR